MPGLSEDLPTGVGRLLLGLLRVVPPAERPQSLVPVIVPVAPVVDLIGRLAADPARRAAVLALVVVPVQHPLTDRVPVVGQLLAPGRRAISLPGHYSARMVTDFASRVRVTLTGV